MSVPLPPRPEHLALLALLGCASPGAVRGRPLAAVPPGALESGWARQRADEATTEAVAALIRDGVNTLRRRRIRADGDIDPLSPAGHARAAAAMVGLRPVASERRWTLLRRLADHGVVGWCARGVRVVEPGGPEGFGQRALTVDRLLVALEGASGRWGFWLEGLVLDGAVWRWLPWVSWNDAVEAPRAAHTDLVMWSCEMERRPQALSGSDSPLR